MRCLQGNPYNRSVTVLLNLNFKKLACELHAALHEPKNICCVSVSAREGDDVSTTRGE